MQINDYIESINQYTAGAFDGVSATNMDTLSIPAGGGVDTTALIVGDFSNGNDAVILKARSRAGKGAAFRRFSAAAATGWQLRLDSPGAEAIYDRPHPMAG
ncbi:MAG: hypothetical protein Tsb0032_39740 [Kiloniellaceae bacterium]